MPRNTFSIIPQELSYTSIRRLLDVVSQQVDILQDNIALSTIDSNKSDVVTEDNITSVINQVDEQNLRYSEIIDLSEDVIASSQAALDEYENTELRLEDLLDTADSRYIAANNTVAKVMVAFEAWWGTGTFGFHGPAYKRYESLKVRYNRIAKGLGLRKWY